MTRRSGLALLIVIGVLGVLALLAVAFVTLARLERKASEQRMNATRALFLARSGLEDAQARLGCGQDPQRPESRYGGEDWDADGTLNGIEASDEVVARGRLNVWDCPVLQAMRPSFHMKDGFGMPVLLSTSGRRRGGSGRLEQGGSYALKVEDESAKIDLNGGFLDAEDRDQDGIPDHRDADVRPAPLVSQNTGLGWNAQLKRVLDLLGSQPEVGIPSLGASALANRPRGGYRSPAELQACISSTTDLTPWLSVSSWADRTVVRPNAFSTQPAGALSDVKKGRWTLALEEGGRPPVNLNAASRPVLVALLSGLKGRSWGTYVKIQDAQITPAMAGGVADALITWRQASPLRTWADFSAFCDSLVPGVINGMGGAECGGGNLCGADLLKANFDPNMASNKEVPDQIRWRWVDKSDLLVWSTEGSLGPTGVFRISSAGRVLGPQGELLAAKVLGQTVEAFRLARQTSQRDFVAGRTALQEYLSLATDPLLRTAGAAVSDPAWWGGPPPGTGLAAMTYPCAPTSLPGQASAVDGAVGLATVESRDQNPVGGTLRFLHHLDDGWNTGRGSSGIRVPGPNDGALQLDPAMPVWPATGVEPGILYPDGAHIQTGRCPAFPAEGNLPDAVWTSGFPSNHGVVSYWVKPVTKPAYLGLGRLQVPLGPQIDFSCVRPGVGDNQSFYVGRDWSAWGFCFECCTSTSDTGVERKSIVAFDADTRYPGARWNLVTAFFDSGETVVGQDLRTWVCGIRGVASYVPDGYSVPFVLPANQDILGSGRLMVLGGQPGLGDLDQSGSVIDEFMICDFGTPTGSSTPLTEAFVAERFAEGRYSKANDAAFLSGVWMPDGGRPVRLLRAWWTAWMPGEPRLESLVPSAGTVPPAGVARLVDASLSAASLDVEILGPAALLADAPLQRLDPGASIDRRLGAFRYRVRLRPTPDWTPAQRDNQPVLETPFFDDITVAYQREGGPRVLAWERGE